MRINVQSADTKALFGLFSHSRPMRSQALPSTTFRVTALRPGVRMDGSGESRAGGSVESHLAWCVDRSMVDC